jgi:asparagine synthase (glutamine-hydrolysing)
MCGLCGILAPSKIAAADNIVPMAQAISHRGPDDSGTWEHRFERNGQSLTVALGHTRLSIMDLSPRGHQPMISRDGRTTVSFNGEIYNFRDIRNELIGLGHRFDSDCDTEVILYAYQAWGEEMFTRFNGMFAIALWDDDRKRLLLARDRLGIKPLYYRMADGVLTFASELKALREHRGFVPRVSLEALGVYLRHGNVCGTQTIYEDTFQMEPGTYLVWDAGRISTHSYWSLVDHGPEQPELSYEEAVDELETRLMAAVERRMLADVPLGAFLSGGVDSSTVVALMQEMSSQKIRTFSIGFEDKAFDEAPYARDLARHIGTDHSEMYVTAAQAREVALELPMLYDEPFADVSAIPTVLLCRIAREEVTVALSGDGGDELLGGYGRYEKFDRVNSLMRIPTILRKGVAALAGHLPSGPRRTSLQRLEANNSSELAESFLGRFPPSMASRALMGRESGISSVYEEVYRRAPAEEPVRRAMYAEARTYLVDDVLTKLDRASMSIALEARTPILDHNVVEFAFSLPMSTIWHGGRGKAPLRTVLDRRVPASLIDRPKQGFGFPVRSLLQNEFEPWLDKYLSRDRLLEEGLMDPEAIRAMEDSSRGRGNAGDLALWNLLSFERWFAVHHRGEDGC